MREIAGLVLASVLVVAFLSIGPVGGFLVVAVARAVGVQPVALLMAIAVVLPLLAAGLSGLARRKAPGEIGLKGRTVDQRKAA